MSASNGGFPDSKKASFGFLPRHGARDSFNQNLQAEVLGGE